MTNNFLMNFFPEKWENHSDVEIVKWIQARNRGDDHDTPTENISSEDEETYNEKQEQKFRDATNNDSTQSSSEENDMPLVVNKFSALSTEQ